MSKPCVLLVEPEPFLRQEIGGWLEAEGYEDVMSCPGPGEPAYTCVASSGAPCPLAKIADVVIVDLKQRSDDAFSGTPGWELVLYYRARGMKVVAIWGHEEPLKPWPDDDVLVIERPIRRDELIKALRSIEVERAVV